MGLFRGLAESYLRKKFQEDPNARALMRKIESYGAYDGTAASRKKAEEVFAKQENLTGCLNKNTRLLFWQVAEETSLPTPLAVCYAYAIGEYLAMPYYNPSEMGGDTDMAYQNAAGLGFMFPEYKLFVERRHSPQEAHYIMALSSGIIENFF